MSSPHHSITYPLAIRHALCTVAALLVAGCHDILDVSDPTLIRASDIANASGANAQRLYASDDFGAQYTSAVQDVAIFTDEWIQDAAIGANITNARSVHLDMRNSQLIEASSTNNSDPHLGPLDHALWQTTIAISAVRVYSPDSLRGDFLAQLYAIRGFLILQMAEDLCPGFPINDVADNQTVYSGPVTTDSAIAYAKGQLDSALTYARDSTRFLTLAQVAKGRALLDQGKYAEAAVVVANVATSDAYTTETQRTFMDFDPECDFCTAVGNHEGGNGLPFGSANDPRVPTQILAVRHSYPEDTLYSTTKGQDAADHIVLASGIEARLMEAEAAFHANQPWKPTLDALRATVGLDTLTDPGTDPARVDMIYRERAFWLFMTGRRLGDLRRLIRVYGRDPEHVFPTGSYLGGNGGLYGVSTAIPFQLANQRRYNPNITTGCTVQ